MKSFTKRQIPVGNPLYAPTHPQDRFARHFGRAALLGQTAEMITANCPERAALQSQIDSTLAGYRKKIQRLEALDIPVTFDTLFETDKSRHAGITIEDGFNAEIERLESLGKSTQPPSTNTPCKC